MKITELLLEVSRSERERQRKERAQQQRDYSRQAEIDALNKLKREQEKLKQKQLQRFQRTTQQKSSEPEKSTSGWSSLSDLEKYIVDPSMDSSFEGGYYLQFVCTREGIFAYWSHKHDATWDQISKNFKSQIRNLGTVFDQELFSNLIKFLVETSSKQGQPGYVQVIISKSNMLNQQCSKFFYDMISYLAYNYPRDEPTADATVGWEVEN